MNLVAIVLNTFDNILNNSASFRIKIALILFIKIDNPFLIALVQLYDNANCICYTKWRLTTSDLFDRGDEVNDFNILRLMAKRSHIISCYKSVVESKTYSNSQESPVLSGYFRGAEDCHCYTEDTTIGLEMNSNENIEKEDVEFHYCPAHSNFKTNMHCNQHVECNDPIYR